MDQRDLGRFTAYGGPEVEQRVARIVAEVGAAAEQRFGADLAALVLFGGYGRGEGGVDGAGAAERPHNNLDFLLIVQPAGPDAAQAKQQLDEVVRPIAERAEIGIDVSAMPLAKLRHAPSLVMWYDMRFGHKTVAGDPALVPGMTHFAAERIPPRDVRDLLVNRGTLLLINDEILAAGAPDEAARRMVVRHVIKGIIGYGDALLFALGAYHWSYLEKQRRMREQRAVDAAFRALYDEALAFRFRPRYAEYVDRDLAAWMDALRAALEPVHRRFEAARLGLADDAALWQRYPRRAFAAAALEEPRAPRAWARKARNAAQGWRRLAGLRALGGFAPLAAAGYLAAGPRGTLPILFPVVAYRLREPGLRALAGAALAAPGDDPAALRRAYLDAWAVHGDSNFAPLLRRIREGSAR